MSSNVPKPTATPSRRPVHLESRAWSCSELQAGHDELKKVKLERAQSSDETHVLEANLQVECIKLSLGIRSAANHHELIMSFHEAMQEEYANLENSMHEDALADVALADPCYECSSMSLCASEA